MDLNLSTAQGDGDGRPFDTHGVDGPALVHFEKSGPAFMAAVRASDLPVLQQLEASVASRTAKTIGELFNALGLPRECFLDVMPAWARLLKILNVTIPQVDPDRVHREYPRQGWEFHELRELVVLALCHHEERDARLHWATADAGLRGYAMRLAHGSESHLANPRDLTDEDVERIGSNAVAYRDFAEGRS